MHVLTNIIVRINTHVVDIHKKGRNTHLNVCIHKYKYSYKYMYTQKQLENFLIYMTFYLSLIWS